MAENTADDAPNDAPAATPIESPLAPRFSGQTYRDRAATPDSDDSDEGPSRPPTRRRNVEPSQSPTEINDQSAGPIPPLDLGSTHLATHPFPPSSLSVLPEVEETSRRGSRSASAHGTPAPSRPPTRGSPTAGVTRGRGSRPTSAHGTPTPGRPTTRGSPTGGITGGRGSRPTSAHGTPAPSRPPTRGSPTAKVDKTSPIKTSGSPTPRRSSAKSTIKQEHTSTDAAESSTQPTQSTPVPPRDPSPAAEADEPAHENPPDRELPTDRPLPTPQPSPLSPPSSSPQSASASASAPPPSSSKAKGGKGNGKAKGRKPKSKGAARNAGVKKSTDGVKKKKAAPRRARQERVPVPPRNTRNRGQGVEYGFDDLERVEREARDARARARARRG